MSSLTWPQSATQSRCKRILGTTEASPLYLQKPRIRGAALRHSGCVAGVATGGESPAATRKCGPGRLGAGRNSAESPLRGRQEKKADLGNFPRDTARRRTCHVSAAACATPIPRAVNSDDAYTGTDKCVGSVRWPLAMAGVRVLPRRTNTRDAVRWPRPTSGSAEQGRSAGPGSQSGQGCHSAQCGQLAKPPVGAGGSVRSGRRVRHRVSGPGAAGQVRNQTPAEAGPTRRGQPAKSAIGLKTTRAGLRTTART